ncbi:MAG TPA: ABC transporter ATP-binding protein [Acidimicrobiia bacterium]
MLTVDDVTVRFGDLRAVDGASLEVGDGERVAILGPSGSGKSTLLRAIGGLEKLESGRILWDGVDLADVPPHRRRFGFMFQGYALFPHMTVGENIAFGLRMEGRDPSEIRARVAEVLEWVGLSGFDQRTVDNLSGGEQQRVALARTLAPDPRLVMLDEPLGALDRALRERLMVEMTDLLTRAGTTALYVTHDHDEAAFFAHRIAIMREGRIVQVGKMEELRRNPVDDWVADFLD